LSNNRKDEFSVTRARQFYIDTNVLISQYKPKDIFYHESVCIVRALKQREVTGYTSPLTILEMVSFVCRNFPLKKGENPEDARRIALSKILNEIPSFQLQFISPVGDYSLKFDDIAVRIPAVLGNALGLATSGLRTLDLMHLSAAKYCKETNTELTGFVTGDDAFLLQKRYLSERIGISFLSPEEFVKLLGLV